MHFTGKQVSGAGICSYYECMDALLHIKRIMKQQVGRCVDEDDVAQDYLQRYTTDKVILLEHLLEKFGDTWEKATAPSRINMMTRATSNNEPWKHVQAVSEGRRYIGERKNRMTQLEHIRNHSATHPQC